MTLLTLDLSSGGTSIGTSCFFIDLNLINNMARNSTPESLVKYETPILVSSSFKVGSAAGGKRPLAPIAEKLGQQSRSEDYLNKILPPQEILENNQLWIRYVSATPATTADVTNLVKDLEKRIVTMEARDSGICPIREELYSQCFDEVIRQITINCAERGYLLVRVRDEVRMVKKTLQGLYDSSIAYGMKKALVAEQRKADMQTRIKLLEKENKELERQSTEMEERIEFVQQQAQ